MARDGKVQTAHDALSAILSASALAAADQLDLRNVFDVMGLILEMQQEVAVDVEVNHPTLAQKKEFADFRKHVEILKGLMGERRFTADALQNLCAYQQKAGEIVASVFAGGPPVQLDDERRGRRQPAQKKAGTMDWEAVKAHRRSWICRTRSTSTARPGCSSTRSTSWTRTRRRSTRSPSTTPRTRTARARSSSIPTARSSRTSGARTWAATRSSTCQNLKPGKPLAIIRRMDYVYGDYEIEFSVDGKNAGICSCAGTDRVHRWRNWPYVIAGELVTKDKVTIKQNAGTAGRDINMFRYWFYQPK